MAIVRSSAAACQTLNIDMAKLEAMLAWTHAQWTKDDFGALKLKATKLSKREMEMVGEIQSAFTSMLPSRTTDGEKETQRFALAFCLFAVKKFLKNRGVEGMDAQYGRKIIGLQDELQPRDGSAPSPYGDDEEVIISPAVQCSSAMMPANQMAPSGMPTMVLSGTNQGQLNFTLPNMFPGPYPPPFPALSLIMIFRSNYSAQYATFTLLDIVGDSNFSPTHDRLTASHYEKLCRMIVDQGVTFHPASQALYTRVGSASNGRLVRAMNAPSFNSLLQQCKSKWNNGIEITIRSSTYMSSAS